MGTFSNAVTLKTCRIPLGKPEFLFQDRDEEVNADSNPNLGANGIVGGAVEGLDSEVLLDPLEEQLHLPPEFEATERAGRVKLFVRKTRDLQVGASKKRTLRGGLDSLVAILARPSVRCDRCDSGLI